MERFIIVGGGFSGLLAARALRKRGIPFVGLERSEDLGGRALIGQYRLYDERSVSFLKEQIASLEFTKVEDVARERKKNDWHEVPEDVSVDEKFYLGAPFFLSSFRYSDLAEKLAEEVQDAFETRKEVTEINCDKRELTCQDGTIYAYDKLIWCTPLDVLNKLWKGDKLPLFKLLKKGESARGGIDLDLEMTTPLFDSKNTVVFPFRFKDKKLRALGTSEEITTEGTTRYFTHWLLFLDSDVEEDREEVAKCLRAMRREIEKEFPEIKTNVKQERIVYLPYISGETPATAKSLEILPGVIYLGPQIGIGKDEEAARNLDRIVDNSRHLETLLDAEPRS
jgi:voltage-gated potassium channel Kch